MGKMGEVISIMDLRQQAREKDVDIDILGPWTDQARVAVMKGLLSPEEARAISLIRGLGGKKLDCSQVAAELTREGVKVPDEFMREYEDEHGRYWYTVKGSSQQVWDVADVAGIEDFIQMKLDAYFEGQVGNEDDFYKLDTAGKIVCK